MSEEYSVGYSEGYQAGWNAAKDATPPAAQRPWVDPTDEQLRQVWYDDAPVEGGTYIDNLRQVVNKTKELNT
jgi:hypothetical protein